MKSSIVLFGLIFSLTACVEVRDKEDAIPVAVASSELPQPHAETHQQPTATKDEPSLKPPIKEKPLLELTHTEAPNSYKVTLNAPATSPVIVKTGGELKEPQRIFLRPEQLTIVDDEAKFGQKYTYQFGSLNAEGKFESKAQVEAKVPIDAVISSHVTLNENTYWHQYRRIYFAESIRITTVGFDFSINASEIHFNNLKIQTFPTGQEAAAENNGRSGGIITIVTRAGLGKVVLELRGEKGGTGGATITEESIKTRELGPMSFSVSTGKIGMRGGNTGSLFVTVENTDNFELFYSRYPGAGGNPGRSSPGKPLASQGSEGAIEKVCLSGPRLLNQCQ